MPRPLSQEKKREKTKESLKNALLSNKMSEKFLEDKVEEYMSFYDDLLYINQTLTTLKLYAQKLHRCNGGETPDLGRDEKHPVIPGLKAGGCGPAVRCCR